MLACWLPNCLWLSVGIWFFWTTTPSVQLLCFDLHHELRIMHDWNKNFACLLILLPCSAVLCCSCLSVWVPFFWLGNSSWWIGSDRRFGGNPRAKTTWPEGVCDDNGNRWWCNGATSDVGKTHRGNERDMGREDGENGNHPQRKVPIRNRIDTGDSLHVATSTNSFDYAHRL